MAAVTLPGLDRVAARALARVERPAGPRAAVRRAIGLIAAGVDGIEIYESEIFAAASHYRWLVPLWGNARLARRFLRESNLESVFPIDAANALGGSDNHWSYSNSV